MGSIFSEVFPLSTFIYVCIDFSILCFVLLLYVVDRDKSYLRFLILIGLFITYFVSNAFFPDWTLKLHPNIFWSILIQNIIAYSTGIILATYYFYFLTIEFDIKPGKLFNVKVLLISLFATFIISYCLVFVLTRDKDLARKTFILIPSLIALYFAFNTTKFILNFRKGKANSYQKTISFTGYVGIFFMATMPVMLLWGDQYKGLNHFVINICLYLTFWASIMRFIHHNSRYIDGTGLSSDSEKYLLLKRKLTKREIEVVTCVGQSKTNKEIGELMFISVSTVRKHLSNIYEKAKVSQIEEFRSKYPNLNQYFFE